MIDARVAAPVVNDYAVQQQRASRAALDTAEGNTTAVNGKSKEQMRKTAQDFEAYVLGQMFEFMSTGIKTDGPFKAGNAEATWNTFLNQQYGKTMAQGRSIGIADAVYSQMLKLQEGTA